MENKREQIARVTPVE